jgi:hypothetical protein
MPFGRETPQECPRRDTYIFQWLMTPPSVAIP